jgi:hypothetical protein
MHDMTIRNAVRFAALAVPLALLFQPAGAVFGQTADRSFGWFAEVVSVDPASSSVTVRAPFLDHVGNYVDSFSAGDEVVLVWTQLDGEADAVLYIESRDAVEIPSGFIVYADFVSADLDGHTVTFTVPQTDSAVSSLVSAQPGTPIRLESPIKQPGAMTRISSVTLNARPAPRPEPEVEEAIVANPDAPLVQIAGDWQIVADVFGSTMELGCAFLQSDTDLSGTCQGPPEQIAAGVDGLSEPIPVTGNVEGNTVTFLITSTIGGTDLELTYTAAVAESGTRMEGSIDFQGMAAAFTGSKQEG